MPEILEIVLDLGYDYGAQGGPDDCGAETVVFPSGAEVSNVPRSRPIREWQIGNRTIDKAKLDYLLQFWMAVRGRVGFLFKDWTDYQLESQQLTVSGGSTAQLVKTYAGLGNDYSRTITRPKISSLSFTKNGAPLTVASVSATTGVVTFNSPYPLISDVVRVTGEFYVPARFETQRLNAQFLALRESDGQRLYDLPSLVVRERLL